MLPLRPHSTRSRTAKWQVQKCLLLKQKSGLLERKGLFIESESIASESNTETAEASSATSSERNTGVNQQIKCFPNLNQLSFPSFPSNTNSWPWTVWVLFSVFVPSIRCMTQWKRLYWWQKLARTTHMRNSGQAKRASSGSAAHWNWRRRLARRARHLLNRKVWAVWCQGDVKAKDDSRKSEKEASWSLLPITPHTPAGWAGQDRWADSSPLWFLLPVREPAFPGSHLFSPRQAAGIILPVHLSAISKSLVHTLSAAAAQCPGLPLPLPRWGLSAHSPAGESQAPTLETPAFGLMNSGEAVWLPSDTKDADREVRALTMFIKCGILVKKKNQTASINEGTISQNCLSQ